MPFKSDRQRKGFFSNKDTVRSDIVPKLFPSGKPIPQKLRIKIFNKIKRLKKRKLKGAVNSQ